MGKEQDGQQPKIDQDPLRQPIIDLTEKALQKEGYYCRLMTPIMIDVPQGEIPFPQTGKAYWARFENPESLDFGALLIKLQYYQPHPQKLQSGYRIVLSKTTFVIGKDGELYSLGDYYVFGENGESFKRKEASKKKGPLEAALTRNNLNQAEIAKLDIIPESKSVGIEEKEYEIILDILKRIESGELQPDRNTRETKEAQSKKRS